MSAQHTQGRLQFHHDHGWLVIESDDGKLHIKIEKGTAAIKRLPDARRLVACWNACEGISTEALELDGNLANGWKLATYAMRDAIAQRDKLLAALEACREMVGHPDNIGFIDAAIAEVKGSL